MDVQIEETGQFGRKVSITVPQPEVDAAFAAVTKSVAKNVRLPGFRPGKAPRSVIEQQYASQILGEVRDRLVEGTLFQALQEKKVSPVGAPQLHLGSLEKGAVFSYTAEFEVQPPIKLTQVKGLKMTKTEVVIEPKEIDDQLETMQKQAAQLVPVMVRDTVQKGDVVLIDYEGTMGGVAFQGGKAENALIEIGGEGYLPQFSEGLENARVPGERILHIDFPADYQAAELAGKGATFKIQLKELKARELPKLDDEFAKDLGEESLATLRTRIEEQIKAQKQRDADQTQQKGLLESLVAANPFDVPPTVVREHAERMIAGAAQRMQQMMGKKVQLLPEEIESLREGSMADAEFQVRSGLLLLEVAESEKLTVDNPDIDAEIEAMAQAAREHGPRVRAHYQEADNRRRLAYRLLEDKTVKFLTQHADTSA